MKIPIESLRRQQHDCTRNDAEMNVGKERHSGDEKGQHRRR